MNTKMENSLTTQNHEPVESNSEQYSPLASELSDSEPAINGEIVQLPQNVPARNEKLIEEILGASDETDETLCLRSPLRSPHFFASPPEILADVFSLSTPLTFCDQFGELWVGTPRQFKFISGTEIHGAERDFPALTRLLTAPPNHLLDWRGQVAASKYASNLGHRPYLPLIFRGNSLDTGGIISHLATVAPLVMVVHAVDGSLQAWFRIRGSRESNIWRFVRYAVTLGADPATTNPWVALPNGLDPETRRVHEVIYLDRPDAASPAIP